MQLLHAKVPQWACIGAILTNGREQVACVMEGITPPAEPVANDLLPLDRLLNNNVGSASWICGKCPMRDKCRTVVRCVSSRQAGQCVARIAPGQGEEPSQHAACCAG